MRLTKPIRKKILDALDEQRHDALRKKRGEEEKRFAELLYRRTVTPEIEKAADALNDLVPGMVGCNGNVYVNLIDGPSGYLFMGPSRPQPHGRMNVTLREDDEVYKDIRDHLNARHEWHERSKAARAAAEATLAKFKTCAALTEGWPEITSIAQPIIDKAVEAAEAKKAAVPALVPAELNEMFGLPADQVEELEAA